MVQKQLFECINAQCDSFLATWQQLYARVQGTLQAGRPQEALALVMGQFQQRAGTSQPLDAASLLWYGTCQQDAPSTVLFCSDLSTLTAQKLLPFIACLNALDAYRCLGTSLPLNITWLVAASDDIHGATLSDLVAQYAHTLQAQSGLWVIAPELSVQVPVIALGTKGRLRITVQVQTASTEVASMHGAVIPNAVWRLVWAMNTLKNAQEEILIDGFYDALRPVEDELVTSLYALPQDPSTWLQEVGVEHMLLGLQGFQLYYTYLLTPTCTLTHFKGGSALSSSCIPGVARAEIEFLLVPEQDPYTVFAQIQAHLQAHGFGDIKLELHTAYAPMRMAAAHPVVKAMQRATLATYEREPYVLPGTAGCYPLCPVSQALDLPLFPVALATSPSGGPGEQKQEQEQASLQDLILQTRHIGLFMHELLHR